MQACSRLSRCCVCPAPEESPRALPRPCEAHSEPHVPLASQDRTCEIVEDTESSRMVKKMKKRICLVLDCLCAHDFSDKTADLINLQHYVIKEKRLSERETVVIFYDVVRVVEALHQVRLCPLRPLLPCPGSVLGHTCLRKQKQLSPTLGQGCFAAGSVPKESGQMIRTQCCRPQPTILGVGKGAPGQPAEQNPAQ